MIHSASIVVAGVGPVGMRAAIEAARHGIDVTVLMSKSVDESADAPGPACTLIGSDSRVNIDTLTRAAARAGMPLKVLDLPPRINDPAFRHALPMLRQDQHVAWPGAAAPTEASRLVDRLCGREFATQAECIHLRMRDAA